MVGSLYGTGSAINVTKVGFRPRVVRLFNVDDNVDAYWNIEFADASMRLIVTSAAGTTDISLETTNGITPLSNGFTIGANANLNASGEKIIWEALS